MRKFKVSPIPHLNGLMFMGKKDPDFVKRIHHFDEKDKKNNKTTALLSAIDFRKT